MLVVTENQTQASALHNPLRMFSLSHSALLIKN